MASPSVRLGNRNKLLIQRHTTESLCSTGSPPAEDSCAGPCMLEAVRPDSCTAAGRGRGGSGSLNWGLPAAGGGEGGAGRREKDLRREGGRGAELSQRELLPQTGRALSAAKLITGWNRSVAMVPPNSPHPFGKLKIFHCILTATQFPPTGDCLN